MEKTPTLFFEYKRKIYMLTQDQLNKYAQVLLWGMQAARREEFSPGDIVMLRYDFAGRRLTEILFDKIIEKGLQPVQRTSTSPQMEYSFYSKADKSQLQFVPPGEEELFKQLNGSIALLAPESLTHLQNIDPGRIGESILAKKHMRDILDERENNGHFGWTLGLLPTEELARNAGISSEEYTEQIVKACYLDYPDPIKQWENIFQTASKIKDKLNSLRIHHLHLKSKDCDLVVKPGQDRQWVGVSGHNIPSFELFTSPDWRGTEGTFFMDQPSYRNGNLVKNLKLEFKNGVVTQVAADQGEEFVKKQIEMDNNANKIGEFSLTDKNFSRINQFMAHTLFDENFGGDHGNCHIALGASYSETYAYGGNNLSSDKKESLGFNDSALHWDLVNTQPKTVEAKLESGETITVYENGSFII